MEYYRCLWALFCLIISTGGARSQRDDTVEVPFGAMFDHSATSSQAAMEYKLYLLNNLVDPDIPSRKIRLLSKDSDRFLNMRDVYSTNTEFCELARKGIFALFGTHTVDTIDALTAYTSMFHMPFISPRMPVNNTGQELGYVLFMHPYYAAAIVDVMRHYQWKEIWYMHSTNEGSIRMQQLFDALARVNYVIKINVIRVGDVDEAIEMLRSIDRRRDDENKRILLDMPLDKTQTFLTRMKPEAISATHHYFIVELGLNEMKLNVYDYGGMNITGFRLFDNDNHENNQFTKDWRLYHPQTFNRAGDKLTHEAAMTMDGISLLVRALSRMRSKNSGVFKQHLDRHGRLIRNNSRELDCEVEAPLPWQLGYDIMKTMREIDFKGITGRVAFDKFGLRRGYELDVLEVTTDLNLSLIGNYHPRRGLVINKRSLVRQGTQYKAPENRTRIVTSILTAPFLMVKPDVEGKYEGNDRYEGYCADLARMISKQINIDYKIIPVKDSAYGSRDKNGTWNGMVGELIRGDADLAIAPLTITAEREKHIHFSKPFMSLGISIMIKKAEKEQPGVFSFMYPLSYEIWMCIIFAYVGVSVVLFLVSRFSPFEWHIEDNTDGPTVTNNFTIFNSLWFSLGAFMQQGCDIEPRSMSGRIVGSMWWFFTLIIISSYTANLAAFLTVQRMHSPIESADDLAKQTEIKYGTVNSGTTKEFFRMSTIPVYERMWAFMSSAEPSVFVKSNEEGVKRVRESNGRFAFLVESTSNDYTNQRKSCDTMKVGNNLDSKGYGLGTPFGSDLRNKITLAVLQLRESGELSTLQTTWWFDKGECPVDKKDKEETTNALKLSNVAGIFYILLGGLTLALLMAAMEFLHKSNVDATRRKTTFINAVRSKARLSLAGKPERSGGVGRAEVPPNMSMSTYTYAPAAQLITFDGYTDPNTHTQV